MDNIKRFMAFSLLAGTILAASVTAQIIDPPVVIPLYPRPILTPSAPSMNDSVTLWLVLGQNSSTCVPTYTPSFIPPRQVPPILVCVRAPCPENYVLIINYKENPPLPLGRPCLLSPTEYGPLFEFGKLAVGKYTVIDSSAGGDTVMTFTVVEKTSFYSVRGTLTQDPGILTVVTPIAKAKVYISAQSLPVALQKAGAVLIPGPDSTTTDANGNFSFANVLQGPYNLSFVAAGFLTRTVKIQVPPDTVVSATMLRINAMCKITGSVKEMKCPAPGMGIACFLAPIPGCTVSVYVPSFIVINPPIVLQKFSAIPAVVYTAVTDKNGLYTVDSIPLNYTDKTVTVTAHKPGYVADSKQATLYDNSAVTVNFILQPAFTNADSNTVDGVTFTVATEKPQYYQGESIKTRYTVTNNSMAKVIFDFSSGCQFDMIAMAPPRDTVYWYGRQLFCTTIMTQIVLAPGESTSNIFPVFVDNDTAGILSVTATLLKYPKSAATVIVPILKQGTPVSPRSVTTLETKKPVICYSVAAKTLTLNIAKSQYVSVSAYVLSGQKIAQLSCKRFMTAGAHTISLNNSALANGIVVFRVEGEGFSSVKRINLMEGR
jgi:hypothetical protein